MSARQRGSWGCNWNSKRRRLARGGAFPRRSIEPLERRDLLAAQPFSAAAYDVLLDRVGANAAHFYVYRDADAGVNHGVVSNFFAGDANGSRADLIAGLEIDLACVEDVTSPTGCSTEPLALDRTRGTVARISIPPLTGAGAYAGIGFEEPADYGVNPRGRGYDLRDATHLVVEARTTNPAGLDVQFSVGGRDTNPFQLIELTQNWKTFTVPLATLRLPGTDVISRPELANVQALFAVLMSRNYAANGGTVLVDNVRFSRIANGQEFAPANPTRLGAGETRASFPVGNETFGVVLPELQVVDDGEANFSVSGTWTHDTAQLAAYLDDEHVSEASGNGAASATWRFEGLEPRVYEVQATWVADGLNTNAAQFELRDDMLPRATATIDQAQAPVGIEFDTRDAGSPQVWQTLGLARVESGTLVVELTNDAADGRLVADGVRLAPTIPPDHALRNLTTTYESALTLLALLHRGEAADLAAARSIADSFLYAQANDPTTGGGGLPTALDGARGLRDSYSSGDLARFNDPGQDEARLPGFSGDERLCGASQFCRVLGGANGGNNAFAIMALMGAYFQFGDSKYLAGAEEIGRWIYGNLVDPDGPAFDPLPEDETFGGYFLGYPDQGGPKDRVADLQRGKSIENNADIFSAFSMIAAAQHALGDDAAAMTWTERANIAGDFVMAMYDPGDPSNDRDGRFYTGTLHDGPGGLPFGPGLDPTGPRKANDVVNVAPVLDSNTFTTLAMAASPRYRHWMTGDGSVIDWREPLRYVFDTFAQEITATRSGETTTFRGFNIVPEPTGSAFRPGEPIGGLPNGIAWEFTAQVVATAQFLDDLEGVSEFRHERGTYLEQLRRARERAPFGDGAGLVAATLDGENDAPGLGHAPLDQCLGTPFQCIAERVGLAATTWGIFAEQGINIFTPQIPLPQQIGQQFVVDDWNVDVTKTDLGFNYFSGNTGATESAEGITTIGLSPESNGELGGSLALAFDFTGQDEEVFAGYFASLFGLTDTLVTFDDTGNEPMSSTPFPDYFLDTQDLFRGFGSFAGRALEALRFDYRLETAEPVTIKIELQDENDFDVFTRRTVSAGAGWQTIDLSLPTAFDDSNQGGGDPSAFDWRRVSKLTLIIERNNVAAGVSNPDSGALLIDNLVLVDSDGSYPDFAAAAEPLSGELNPLYRDAFLDHIRATSAMYFTDWSSTDPRSGGIIQDRSAFADLLTVGGVGFQLTSYAIDAERGYLPRAEAANRVRDLLRVLHDQPQGPENVGTIGHHGFFYHFLGIDGLRKQNFDVVATTEIDESLNTVELSTIDTALAVAGAVTVGQYFDEETAIETEIRELVAAIYGRVDWRFMLDDQRYNNSQQFFLGWKPNEDRDDLSGRYGRFLLDDDPVAPEGQYSSKPVAEQEVPATIDYYTDEGLLIALLAMGSPNPDHRLGREVWDAMIRDTGGGSFVRTYPGALFTYQFAGAWLDTELLGTDSHQAIHGRPAMPVNFYDNTRAAILATRDYTIANPEDRVTWQDGRGAYLWGLSAAEGPFDAYHAYGAPTAALGADAGIVTPAGSVDFEAEDGSGDGLIRPRGNASGAQTVQLDAGETRTLTIAAPYSADYRFVVRYSNDNFGPLETIEVRIDGDLVDSFSAADTGDFGSGWDVFVESAESAPFALAAGSHEITIHVTGGDGFGVEIDQVRLLHDTILRPLEEGTATIYGVGSAVRHAPEEALAGLWETAKLGLFHPRFGAADAFNLEISDAVISETAGGEILRTTGSWRNPTGFSIDHGPMLILIDNYLENDFAPRMFMSHPDIARALRELFPDWLPDHPWPWQNYFDRYDVNDDGDVVPLDALVIINDLNTRGARCLDYRAGFPDPPRYYDVNGDGAITPNDALVLINYLNQQLGPGMGAAEGEGGRMADRTTSRHTAAAGVPAVVGLHARDQLFAGSVAELTDPRSTAETPSSPPIPTSEWAAVTPRRADRSAARITPDGLDARRDESQELLSHESLDAFFDDESALDATRWSG